MAKVQVQVVVDRKQVDELSAALDKINGQKITIQTKEFAGGMREAATAAKDLGDGLAKVTIETKGIGQMSREIRQYKMSTSEALTVTTKFNKATKQYEESTRYTRNLANEQREAAKAAEKHAKYVAECNKEYAKYQQYVASMQKNTPIQNRIDALTGVYRDDPVTRKEFTDFGRLLIKQEEQAAKAAEKAAAAQKKEEEATADANKEVKKQGLLYDILGRSVSDFILRMTAYRAVYAGIRAITSGFKEALETLKAVDDELVTVRKVTGFDSTQMAQVEAQAYAVASKYGTSAEDYTASVANYARAGYKELSGALAELAQKTVIVGDTTGEVADQFLLSVDAAYKYNGSIQKLSAVLDGANEIDNKYATSIAKIAEGMGIVAPVAAQMHVGVDELAASIGTITAVTQRTGTEAARALRAIYLNIVGDTKTEIEEGVTWTTGEIAGLRDVIKLYAKDAWDAAQASGGIIDPMEAIAGLSKSVKDGVLSEAKLMEMVSDIGGKLRTSQLLALINNWDMYESMLNDYRNAYGSADKEIENAMDSWTRKSEVLKNKWTEFVKTSLNSEVFKFLLDTLAKIVERLGTLAGVVTRLIPMFAALKLREMAKNFSEIQEQGGLVAKTLNKIGASAKGLNIASAAFAAFGTVLSVVSYLEEDAKRKHEEAVQKIYDEADASKEASENILSLYADYVTAAEGSDTLTDSTKRLADALGTDIPEGAEKAAQAIRDLTIEQLNAKQGDLYEAVKTAREEFANTAIDAMGTSVFGMNGLSVVHSGDSTGNTELDGLWRELLKNTAYMQPKGTSDAYIFSPENLESVIAFRKQLEVIVDKTQQLANENKMPELLDGDNYVEAKKYLADTQEAFDKLKSTLEDYQFTEYQKQFVELTSAIKITSEDAYKAFTDSIRENLEYTDKDKDALIGLAEMYFPQYAKAAGDAEDAVDGHTDAVKKESEALDANQKALDANATATERAAAAKKDAEAAVHRFIDALFDENGELTSNAAAAMTASSYLADLAQAELDARTEAANANYAALRAELAAVSKAALQAASSILAMEAAYDAGENSGIDMRLYRRYSSVSGATRAAEIMRQISALESQINNLSVASTAVGHYSSAGRKASSSSPGGSGGSGSSGSSGRSGGSSSSSSESAEDKKLKALQNRVALLKSELSLMQARGDSEEDQIAKMKEIQKALYQERLYLDSIKADQITINGVYEDWWELQNKITDIRAKQAETAKKEAEDAAKAAEEEQEAAEARVEAIQKALDAQLALNNALKDRSVRYYNASTGQWEWGANQSNVKSAFEAYANAVSAVPGNYAGAFARYGSAATAYGLGSSLGNFLSSGSGGAGATNNYGATYNFGGVTLTEAQAKAMTVYDLARLSNSLCAYNNSV